ncbi:MAG: LytR/AlgR family response regulator transcription factor [Terriglobia bacterium]
MRKPRILVVDDNPVIHEVFESIIDHERYVLEMALSGRDALEQVDGDRFDVVFLDLRMPGMDGGEVLKELRRVSPEARVYTMTGFELPAKIEETLRGGAAGSIFKPFDIGEVSDIVENHSVAMTKLPVRRGPRTLLLRTDLISFVCADGGSISVHTFDRKYRCRLTLAGAEARLSTTRFFRAHRCYLANLDMVKEVEPGPNGSLGLVMEDQAETIIPVSRNRAKLARQRLGIG